MRPHRERAEGSGQRAARGAPRDGSGRARRPRPRGARRLSSPPAATRALRNRNFRIYIVGQGISQVGSWFQQTAEVWLILQLTGSAQALGVQSALRWGPLLVFGIPAGVLTDRIERRRLLFVTQSLYVVTAGVLAVAAFAGTPPLLLVYGLVLVRGFLNAVDNPLRRGFIRDLVTDEELTNAVSMNSTINTLARFIGPALAGVVIVSSGVAWCFALNAVSFGAVLISLFRIDAARTRPSGRVEVGLDAMAEGLRYVWRERRIRRTLATVAVLGLVALNWDVILPVYATTQFAADASLYGLFVSTVGAGAFVVAAFVISRKTRITGADIRTACVLMTGALVLLAVSPVVAAAFVGLLALGAANTSFQIFAQSRLQLEAEDRISGRVLAIYSVALVGTRPIGALLLGTVVDTAGPRAAFLLSAASVAVLVVALLVTRASRPASTAEPFLPVDDATSS